MKKRLLITAAAVLIVAGCGGGVGYQSGELGKGWITTRVPYRGSYLICVLYNAGGGNANWGGPSCDWVDYHRRQDKR